LPHEGPVWDFICELDALIDGPFIMSQRDLTLKFRGSKNQRILHLKNGEIVSQE
jgi:anaerobic ribonucleoside-triphosphate reductase activating protein